MSEVLASSLMPRTCFFDSPSYSFIPAAGEGLTETVMEPSTPGVVITPTETVVPEPTVAPGTVPVAPTLAEALNAARESGPK